MADTWWRTKTWSLTTLQIYPGFSGCYVSIQHCVSVSTINTGNRKLRPTLMKFLTTTLAEESVACKCQCHLTVNLEPLQVASVIADQRQKNSAKPNFSTTDGDAWYCPTHPTHCKHLFFRLRQWVYWSLILRTYLPSVLWHSWLGHSTPKTRPRYDP